MSTVLKSSKFRLFCHVAMSRGILLIKAGRKIAPGIQGIEVKEVTKHTTVYSIIPTTKKNPLKMSIVLSFESPGKDQRLSQL